MKARFRAGNNERLAMLSALFTKAIDEIRGEKRPVGCRRDHERDARAIDLCPRDPRMNAGEKASMAGDTIHHHGKTKASEARQVAIGDDDEVNDLRPVGEIPRAAAAICRHRPCGSICRRRGARRRW
jgi:hypothetical protein